MMILREGIFQVTTTYIHYGKYRLQKYEILLLCDTQPSLYVSYIATHALITMQD